MTSKASNKRKIDFHNKDSANARRVRSEKFEKSLRGKIGQAIGRIAGPGQDFVDAAVHSNLNFARTRHNLKQAGVGSKTRDKMKAGNWTKDKLAEVGGSQYLTEDMRKTLERRIQKKIGYPGTLATRGSNRGHNARKDF